MPALFEKLFQSAFAGFGLAAIAIGALVPASIMSIAADNLFSRNVFSEFIRPKKEQAETARVAKITAMVPKFLALAFILTVPAQYALYYQTAGGVWILQTLPAVFLALFVPWLDRWATLLGWAVGIAWGTYLLVSLGFRSSQYPFQSGAHFGILYIWIPAVVANRLVALVFTAIARMVRVPRGRRTLTAVDFQAGAAK
jgi:SSS family solute:Na+ symporter